MDELNESFSLGESRESKLFELFCNYCVTSKHYFGRFDPRDVTTEEDDAAIDGISIVVDGDLVTTVEDARQVFNTHKTSLSVDLIFTQCKSGEGFKKDEISNYKMGIEDFLSFDPKLPNGKLNGESLEIVKVIFENLKKVKNRRPNAIAYYCTSGTYKAEREIKGAFEILNRYIEQLDYFHKVSVIPMGRGEILKLYTDLSEKNEARLKLIDYCGMPAMPGIPQSYLAVVNARNFVDALLADDEGNLLQNVFEENVRSFLGVDNDVNSGINQTLNDGVKKKLFSVLNNGITVVAPELTLTPNLKEIHLSNYQIINGCQTSNTLYENRAYLSEDVNVVVKFIESPDNDVSTDIIAATNSQSDVAKETFHALKDKAKHVQKYFNVMNSEALPENRIYFERRENEYHGAGHQNTRIFDVRELARCYAASFLGQPHNSARYVSTIFSASGDSLFREDDDESYYYVSALALYKYNTLINGKKSGAHNFIKLRWHVLHLFKFIVHGKTDFPPPNSKKAGGYSQKIIEALTDSSRSYVKKFEQCQKIIEKLGIPSDDALKRGRYTQDLVAAAAEHISKAKPAKTAKA